eukprot:s944_g6.t1
MVAMSVCEAELMEGSTCALLLESTQAMLEEILPDGRPPTLYIDNMAANNILNGSMGSWRTRHLRIRHSYVLDRVAKGQLAVRHLAGEDQPADLPTKLHSRARLLHLLGVWNMVGLPGLTGQQTIKFLKLGCLFLLMMAVQSLAAAAEKDPLPMTGTSELLLLLVITCVGAVVIWEAVKASGKWMAQRLFESKKTKRLRRLRELARVAAEAEIEKWMDAGSVVPEATVEQTIQEVVKSTRRVIWRLVYGLITAGQKLATMFSTTLLIGLVLFICGCVSVEIITKNKAFCLDPTSETCQVVNKHFADLGTSILTLVQFVTLDSIAEVYFPIIVQQPLLLVFFLPILMFVSITLMNLITAVLVENALEFAAHEAEAERIKTKQRVKEALPRLLEIFNEIDEDASGCVTHDEIEKVSVDVLPPRLLETVSVDSMTDLFELLDVDGSGRLTRGEFVEGLLNLVLMDVPIWTIQSLKLLRLIRGQTLKLDEELASLKASLSKDEQAI